MKIRALAGAVGRAAVAIAAMLCLLPATSRAQDRLKTMPGYARYQRMLPQIRAALGGGGFRGRGFGGGGVTWANDGRSVQFTNEGKEYRYDMRTRRVTEAPPDTDRQRNAGRGRGGVAPARGRQFGFAIAPVGDHRAIYRDRNVWIGDSSGANAVQITRDGSTENRIKYGTASWVYGEELSQRTAMWWSPDGKKLAYYRFDESKVPDFYITTDLTHLYDTLDVEAYPKPGVPNPVVDLYVYDVDTKAVTHVDVRDGKPFENSTVGYYVYHVAWSPDGKELTFLRANRRQNVMELTACNPTSGACRVVLREDWPTGWVDDDPGPSPVWLADSNRFVWESERNGFRNYYLYDFKAGKLLHPITHGAYEVGAIERLDEPHNAFYYMARDGDNYMKLQLHRVKLDGTGDVRLTDPAFTHTVSLSPDGRTFVDVAETHDSPPVTRLLDATNGKVIQQLATTDMSRFDALGLKKPEMFTFTAADGATQLHGMIDFPSNFDPSKRYPVLVTVYGGPASASNTSTERFAAPNPLTEYGFLVVRVDSRATPGMGKKQLDALYLKLGQTEMDDMAAGVKSLFTRPYVDAAHVGIYGTSYGGYTSLMELLRHPEVFSAASSSSPPTDWRNYDTIYTERYMWIPQENAEGYDKGSAMTYANTLHKRLMLYYGTADNNVHNTNMMQMIIALQHAGKSFDVQVGPDMGHSGLNQDRMMEFFIENLVLTPSGVATTTTTGSH
jgi:dipeptidyl-peptidase-4